MYTFCEGCRHIPEKPSGECNLDEWRGRCSKDHQVWAHRNAEYLVAILPVSKGICPDIEERPNRFKKILYEEPL